MQHITNTELLIIRHLKRHGYDPKSTKHQTLKKLVGMNYALYACHVNEDAIFNCLFDIIEKFDLLPYSKKGKNIRNFFIYQYSFEPDFDSQWESWIYRCATTIRLTNVDKFPRYPKPLSFKNWEIKITHNQHMTYDIEDVREYMEGLLWSKAYKKELTMNEILAMLKNTLVSIEDGDDGLAAYIERKKYYENAR